MTNKLSQSVALTIRHFRKSLDMSQEELADISGLDRTYISGVERGVRNISLNSLEKIVVALGVDFGIFFDKLKEEINELSNK